MVREFDVLCFILYGFASCTDFPNDICISTFDLRNKKFSNLEDGCLLIRSVYRVFNKEKKVTMQYYMSPSDVTAFYKLYSIYFYHWSVDLSKRLCYRCNYSMRSSRTLIK